MPVRPAWVWSSSSLGEGRHLVAIEQPHPIAIRSRQQGGGTVAQCGDGLVGVVLQLEHAADAGIVGQVDHRRVPARDEHSVAGQDLLIR
jgi:hypothetical protein